MTAQPTAPLSEAPVDAETVAHLMAPAVGVFHRDMSVAETVEELRELTRAALITYCYVTDEAGKLEGVVVMRDMLLAEPEAKLEDLMLRDPYWLPETLPLDDALKAALARHYPVYPVCDEAGHLKGLVRGEALFADRAVEISAQAGKMVGVEKEERLATPLMRSMQAAPSLAADQPADRVRRRRRRRHIREYAEPARHPRRLPAGDGRARPAIPAARRWRSRCAA